MTQEARYKKLPLTLEQALSGKSIKIQLPGGSKIKLNLKKGLYDGQLLRLKEPRSGQASGRQSGELILQVSLLDHPFYQIDQLNIKAELPLSPAEAYSGCVRTFAGPDGKSLRLEIPPRTKDGDFLRIEQGGLKKGFERGDLEFTIRIDENMALIEYMAVSSVWNQPTQIN